MFRWLARRHYVPLNRIELSKKSVRHNYSYLLQTSHQLVAPVLKSNAYGHGLLQIAKIVDQFHPPFLCVDSLYEAYELEKIHVNTPILIMGYVHPKSLATKELPFSYAVYTDAMLFAIKKYQPHAGVHIFVDTGMHREGVATNDLKKLVVLAKRLELKIDGLMSHFGMSERPDDLSTKKQVETFKKAKKIVYELNIQPKWIHIGASSAILHKEYQQLGNVFRTGIALYGIDPERKDRQFKPVLQLLTTIAQTKTMKKGEKIGYDFTYTAPKNMQIAILPIGYNEGVDRRLSNIGYVKVKKKFCPIIGRVSMNITTIDVSKITTIREGDTAVVFSNDPEANNSLASAAKHCSTIEHDLLVHLHPSINRIVI